MMRQSKFAESRMNTLGNEMMHVNNSLNLNFVETFSLTKQDFSGQKENRRGTPKMGPVKNKKK